MRQVLGRIREEVLNQDLLSWLSGSYAVPAAETEEDGTPGDQDG